MQGGMERLTFPGGNGATLAGRLERPFGELRAVALFAHCFTCTKDSHAATRIASHLAELGIATLRFDFTGLGGSDGDFAMTGFSANVADIVAAADFLRETLAAPVLLIGHSLGGAAVIAAAARIKEAKAVVTIGAPFDAAHVLGLLGDVSKIEREGRGTVSIAGRHFPVTRDFLHDARQQKQADSLAHLDKALLILHAPNDEYVDIDNARQIFAAARHPKSFITLDHANHLLTDPADAAYAASLIAAWVSHYLPPPTRDTGVPQGTVVIETAGGAFTQMVTAGPHRFLADEPVDKGGDDRGPMPTDYILTALGCCTAMTMQFYARRETLPLEAVRVTMTLSQESVRETPEAKPILKTTLHRRIVIKGDLDEAQHQDLIRVAEKCPVHKLLTGRIVIETQEER
jgi:putative redox protein